MITSRSCSDQFLQESSSRLPVSRDAYPTPIAHIIRFINLMQFKRVIV